MAESIYGTSQTPESGWMQARADAVVAVALLACRAHSPEYIEQPCARCVEAVRAIVVIYGTEGSPDE